MITLIAELSPSNLIMGIITTLAALFSHCVERLNQFLKVCFRNSLRFGVHLKLGVDVLNVRFGRLLGYEEFL